MSSNSVIVFGATGNVGRPTAQAARALGAKVSLGMRDTSATIPNLSPEEEKSEGYERISADLTKPESLITAVKASNAKAAFIYSAHSSDDGMKSAMQALKSAGIEFIVMLSSYLIPGDPADVPETELIPFLHAKVELVAHEVFGSGNYLAVRVGNLATNTLRFKAGISKGLVRTFRPDLRFDWVDAEDIGAVCGYYLAKGATAGQKDYVYVHGPEILSQGEAVIAIGKQLGVDVDVQDGTEEEERQRFAGLEDKFPPAVVDYGMGWYGGSSQGQLMMSSEKQWEDGSETIRRCKGKEPTTLRAWADKNKQLFV